VARVDAAGVLTALSHGSADVIAAVANAPAGVAADDHPGKGVKGGPGGPGSKPIKVRNSGSLAVQPLEVTLTALEDVAQLQARLIDATGSDAETRVTWRSLDQKTASVNDDGLVESRKRGSARVVAAAKCCGADTVVVQVEPRVADIQIANCPSSLEPGEQVGLLADAVDSNGYTVEDATIRWTTSDATVASVDPDGNLTASLTANAAGSALITAAADDATEAVSVTVVDEELGVARLTVKPATHTFTRIGEELKLSVVAITAAGDTVRDPAVTWTTSNADVVSVDKLGKAVARGLGSALIYASSAVFGGASASMTVREPATGDYPNLPQGMTLIGRADGSVLGDVGTFNGNPAFGIPGFGRWWEFCQSRETWPAEHLNLVDDPTNPTGSGKAIQIDIDASGCGAIATASSGFPGGPWKEFYVMFRVWRDPATAAESAHKWFYLWMGGERKYHFIDTPFPSPRGAKNLRVVRSSGLGPFSGDSTGQIAINSSDSPPIGNNTSPLDYGRWVTVELHFVAESAPVMHDGEVTMWIDGEFIAHRTNIRWTNEDWPHLFDGMQWYGHHSNRDRVISYRIGELYLAGKPAK
jgi:uncharacterized protein YjdB